MSVTDYLERARECAALADKAKERHKRKILAIADAWLKLADDAALEAKQESKANGKLPRRRRLTAGIPQDRTSSEQKPVTFRQVTRLDRKMSRLMCH